MPQTLRLSSSLAALLALAACAPRAPSTDGATAASGGPPPVENGAPSAPPKTVPSTGAADRVTVFACDGGHRVEADAQAAVVHLADGREIRIERAPDDATRFAGEALAFRRTGLEGELSQDEGGRFACKAEAS